MSNSEIEELITASLVRHFSKTKMSTLKQEIALNLLMKMADKIDKIAEGSITVTAVSESTTAKPSTPLPEVEVFNFIPSDDEDDGGFDAGDFLMDIMK